MIFLTSLRPDEETVKEVTERTRRALDALVSAKVDDFFSQTNVNLRYITLNYVIFIEKVFFICSNFVKRFDMNIVITINTPKNTLEFLYLII